MVKRRRKPKGWVGEPGRHALARRGIESVRLDVPPVQVFNKAVTQEMAVLRHKRAQLQDPETPFDDIRLLREQIKMGEHLVLLMVKRDPPPELIKLREELRKKEREMRK